MKTATVDQIMRLKPCEEYPRERIEELFAGRERVTGVDVLDAVPWVDATWVVTNPDAPFLSPEDRRAFFADCAARVLHFMSLRFPDLKPRDHDMFRDAIRASRVARGGLDANRILNRGRRIQLTREMNIDTASYAIALLCGCCGVQLRWNGLAQSLAARHLFDGSSGVEEEREWQRALLIEYLRGERR